MPAMTKKVKTARTEYQKLYVAERMGAHTIEIIEAETGKRGVANSSKQGVDVFYGSDDGSDDATVSFAEFNARFKVTSIIFE